MGAANSSTIRHAGRCILASCVSALFVTGAATGEDGKESKSEASAKASRPRFASERPKLRPLFGKPHEEGVENNKFNDGGERTVSETPLKGARGTTAAGGFDPDPGGVTPPIFNPDPGASCRQTASRPGPDPGQAFGGACSDIVNVRINR